MMIENSTAGGAHSVSPSTVRFADPMVKLVSESLGDVDALITKVSEHGGITRRPGTLH